MLKRQGTVCGAKEGGRLRMKLRFGIYFCTDEGERFFGEGPYRLLAGIQRHGSLRAAAQQMGMAYTKAFALLKRAEQEFGFALTRRRVGGKGGGGSVLTEPARELMLRYEAYRAACTRMAESLYHTHFSSFQPEAECFAEGTERRGEGALLSSDAPPAGLE